MIPGEISSMLTSGAQFSPCRLWRYALLRRWSIDDRMIAFIGLNPSTANELTDDPTIRRCRGFARDWGYSGMVMLNLFAWRATDPEALKQAHEPVGHLNDEALREWCRPMRQIICCWGKNGRFRDRDYDVLILLNEHRGRLFCLGHNADGTPRHPLYLPRDAAREEFSVKD